MSSNPQIAHPVRIAVLSVLLAALWLLLWTAGVHAAGASDDDTRVRLPLVISSPPLASPAFASEAPTTAAMGVPYAYAVQISGYPTPTLELAQGPPGMAMDASGTVQWTPDASGTFAVILRASNGVIPDAEQFYEIEVAPEPAAPVITSSPIVSAAVDADYRYQVEATGFPSPDLSLDDAPAGMSIDEAGVIRWSPAAEGTYTVSVRAFNGIPPDDVQSFTVYVAPPPPPVAPQIVSDPVESATVGELYAYPVAATGYPQPQFSLAPGKPDGMTINQDGLIAWTPTVAGDYAVTVLAQNGAPPDAAQSFTIVVASAPVAPDITSTPQEIAAVGESYTYQMTASGYPAPELDLDIGPPGMSMDANGLVQWTPTSAGVFAVSVRASNGVFPDAVQDFSIEVTPAPLSPAIISAPVTEGVTGELYTYQVQATGYPQPGFWFENNVRPSGMTISGDGLIQWTPSAAGSYDVTVAASNGMPPYARQSFTIEAALAPRIWDPRLDLRYATLVEADVGSGDLYWRLIEAHWFNLTESDGRHHIFMDVLDGSGARKSGVPLRITWTGGSDVRTSEEKAGEVYATDFDMYAVAPAYNAWPEDGLPVDRVYGMGLGEIDDPFYCHHTSYLLIWQKTVMP